MLASRWIETVPALRRRTARRRSLDYLILKPLLSDRVTALPEIATSERLARRWFALVQHRAFEQLTELVHEDIRLVSKVQAGTVVDDPTNNFSQTGPGVTKHEFVIPAGTRVARVALFDAFTLRRRRFSMNCLMLAITRFPAHSLRT